MWLFVRKSFCGMGLVWAWYGTGVGLVWAWYGADMGLVWAWYGLVVVGGLVWAWYGPGMGLVWAWYGDDIRAPTQLLPHSKLIPSPYQKLLSF